MTIIRAHFDGRVFVPDEPVDLPTGREVKVEVPAAERPEETKPSPEVIEERLRRFRATVGLIEDAPHIPNEALRRVNLYKDRGV